MKKIALLAAAAAFISVPAMAQEQADMGGLKVGVVAGYDSVKLKFDGDSGSKGGFQYGVTAGYDFDMGGAVVGVEAELADATTKETVADAFFFGDEFSLAASREIYVGGRVGAKVGSNALLYVKGGYVNSKFKLSYDDGDGFSFRDSDKLDGFRIGAGAEMTKSNYFGRLEYRYTDLGTHGREDLEDLGFDDGLKASRHQVVATVGVRF